MGGTSGLPAPERSQNLGMRPDSVRILTLRRGHPELGNRQSPTKTSRGWSRAETAPASREAWALSCRPSRFGSSGLNQDNRSLLFQATKGNLFQQPLDTGTPAKFLRGEFNLVVVVVFFNFTSFFGTKD